MRRNDASMENALPEVTMSGNTVEADGPVSTEQYLPIVALREWIGFLQGPTAVFKRGCTFENEWRRLFRLGSLVLLMMGMIIAFFSLGIAESGQKWTDLSTKTQYFALTLVIGALVAVPYAFLLAPLFRIRITLEQTFFTVLLLWLPWVPLIGLVWSIGKVWTNGLLVVVLFYILSIIPVYNFCRGVSQIAACRPRRVVLSLAIPVVLALTIFIANKV